MRSKFDARDWLSAKFSSSLQTHSQNLEIKSVAVVGGGPNEPELEAFTDKSVEVYYFGIEKPENVDNFFFLDLDTSEHVSQKFDLVICNQVIEHLYKLQNAFGAISKLVASDGFLWITAPANNFRHGSPHYYSAGYSREFLSLNLKDQGFEILELGELSSKRVYFYRHLLKTWPTYKQIRFPAFSYFGVQGSLKEKISFNIRNLPARVVIALASRKWEIDGEFPVETFGLFKKIEKTI
jgi:SAM-dependent methyltransferase